MATSIIPGSAQDRLALNPDQPFIKSAVVDRIMDHGEINLREVRKKYQIALVACAIISLLAGILIAQYAFPIEWKLDYISSITSPIKTILNPLGANL